MPRRNKKLQLFVWTDHCSDYTPGLAFAIAHDEKEARELVIKEKGWDPPLEYWGDLQILPLNSPVAFAVSGGS